MSNHPAPTAPATAPTLVLVHDSDGECRTVFGPFPTDEAARDWAEQALTRRVWSMQDLTAPFTP